MREKIELPGFYYFTQVVGKGDYEHTSVGTVYLKYEKEVKYLKSIGYKFDVDKSHAVRDAIRRSKR